MTIAPEDIKRIRRTDRRMGAVLVVGVVQAFLLFGILLVLLADYCAGQTPQGPVQARSVPTVVDGVLVAARHAANHPSPETLLYLWYPALTDEQRGAAVYAANLALNHSNRELRVQPRAGPNVRTPVETVGGNLLAVDLAFFSDADPRIFQRLRKTLDSVYVDPYFYVRLRSVDTGAEIPAFTPIIQQMAGPAATALIAACQAKQPILFGPRFTIQSLRNTGGGVYADVRDFRGKTNQEFLKLFGADKSASEALDGDSLVATFMSRLHGRPRRSLAFYGVGVAPSKGIPIVTMTQDPDPKSIDPNRDPIYNLGQFAPVASETIAILPSGFPATALHDGEDKFVDSVPQAAQIYDTAVPGVFSKELDGGPLSCGICHTQRGGSFWAPHHNSLKNISVLSVEGQTIAAKYQGDLAEPLSLLHIAHNRQAVRVSGLTSKQVWTVLDQERTRYLYSEYTPRRFARLLGFSTASDAEAALLLRQQLPARGAVVDPTLEALRNWDEANPEPLPVGTVERVIANALERGVRR